MSQNPARKPYHHGDARNALLRAARELLEANGAAHLSLRQVAEQAGLSRQAPYNHFEDKEALLAELVREGFEHLARDMEAADSDSLSPVARLERAGASYIGFAQDSPALFRLMFSREHVDMKRHPAADASGRTAFSRLKTIVAAVTSGRAVDDGSLVAWSLVHGYATLCLEAGLEGPDRREARASLFARTVAALASAD